MAVIKAQRTLGNKLHLSLEASPLSGGGTPAPIGSFAQVDDAGVGSVWIKQDAGDLDWVILQTEVWNFATSLAGLNAATDDSYFGTNSLGADKDIIFTRFGNELLRFTTFNTVVAKNQFSVTDALDDTHVLIQPDRIEFLKNSKFINIAVHNGGMTINLDPALRFSTDSLSRTAYVKQDLDGYDGVITESVSEMTSSYSFKRARIFKSQLIDNTGVTLLIPKAISNPFDVGPMDDGHLDFKVSLFGTADANDSSAIFRKDAHLYKQNIIDVQDTYTHQDANAMAANVSCTVTNDGTNYQIILKSLVPGKAFDASYVTVFLLEDRR